MTIVLMKTEQTSLTDEDGEMWLKALEKDSKGTSGFMFTQCRSEPPLDQQRVTDLFFLVR